MSAKQQHNNILLAVFGFTCVVAIVGLIGYFTIKREPDVIQGEVEVGEYRVSSKLPGRVVEIRVREGDYVRKGDTLAILEVPEATAQQKVAESTEQATKALSDLAENGNRAEAISSAYHVYQQSLAAREIAQKTYQRMEKLYKEGVVSQQKRDEAQASFKAAEASVEATKSTWEMAKNGKREEERRAAEKQTQAARHAVGVVSALLRETVQVATADGEVTDVYPKVGELVGLGSPIMTIATMNDMWGTFNVREDQLNGMKVGDTFSAYVPAFKKNLKMRVYYMKDEGTYAAWKATKTNGDYDLKTFEVKARPVTKIDGLRPGMSLILK